MKKIYTIILLGSLVCIHYANAEGMLKVKTIKARDVGPHSVILDGVVMGSGGKTIESFGFEYGKTTDYGQTAMQKAWVVDVSENKPLTFAMHISDVSGVGIYNGNLDCSAKYHYRAYVGNSSSKSYGEDKVFTTKQCGANSTGNQLTRTIEDSKLPKVETMPATEIGRNSVVLNGNLTDTGGESNLFFNFNYQKVGDAKKIGTSGELSKTGPFSVKITEDYGLQCNSEYNFYASVSSPNVVVDYVTAFSDGAVLKFKTLPCDVSSQKVLKDKEIPKRNNIKTFFSKFKFW